MKVLHLCYADARGGAAIGAYRLHKAMGDCGVDSRMLVAQTFTGDDRVTKMPRGQKFKRWTDWSKKILSHHHTDNPVLRSVNVFPTGTLDFINQSDADLVQIHWVGIHTISIAEIARINKPVFWKLPDMWPFSGAEHYTLPDDPPRYRDGYKRSNRPAHEAGIDLNKWIWRYKRWAWRNTELNIVTPSQWLGRCARESVLFGRRPQRTIPNPLDLEVFAPSDRAEARREFGLPLDARVILFGSLNAKDDRRKGYHHLLPALERLGAMVDRDNTILTILGADQSQSGELAGFKVKCLGQLTAPPRIARAISAADVFVLPTEMDNLPNTVKEASCCGVPTAAFDVGGVPDMVRHRETGWLAKPYDTQDLAEGLAWLLDNVGPEMRARVRAEAEARHTPRYVVDQYLDYYRSVVPGP